MQQNDLIFVRDTIRQLKREYGGRLVLGKTTINSQDPTTGRADITTTEFKIPRAIRLPNQVSFDFLKSISNGKMGQLISNSFMILLDKSDLPPNFPKLDPEMPTIGLDYGEFDNQRLEILKGQDFQYAVILWVRQLPGRVGVRRSLKDTFGISDAAINQP